MSEPRIGVYICHCGKNIAGVIDVSKLVEYASKLPGVVVAREYPYMCSSPGQELVAKDIRELGVNRVVIAACSPKMHEQTFQKVLEKAGVNPHLLEFANIREHVTWVHSSEPEKALEKAKALVAGAVAKAALLEPIEPERVSVKGAALVVGGGIAGIRAALDIANAGFKVYLVEKQPSIGGHMAKLDKTFPTLDCSQCILTPLMVEAASHPNIELMTYSEVESVEGYVG
ncbi:MAG: disulfide reductase, partial [Thermoproteota archaeon]